MNKVANVRVWEEYKLRCDKDMGVDVEAAGICSADGVEEGWMLLKDSMGRLEAVARDIYKGIGKAQKVRMGRIVKYDSALRKLKRARVVARRRLDSKLRPGDQPKKWRSFKSVKNRMKKVAHKKKMQLLEEEADELDRLGKKHAGIQWRQVKGLVPKRKQGRDIPTALDSKGVEVYGDAVLGVWRTAYEKLGKEGQVAGFGEDWKDQVEGEVERMETESKEQESSVELDSVISLGEVKRAVKDLKAGKAAGSDGVVNELIKFGGGKVVSLVWNLLRNCFDEERVPEQWLEGIIFPLYKQGDKRDPYNYRGISLLSVVSKIYEMVLYRRLDEWCERRGIIREEQGGFRAGRGCVDQIFVLDTLLNSRGRRRTYCCFIDIKKAYDTVWRKGLWKCLWDKGIRGKMWRVIKDFYRSTRCKIRVGKGVTEEFSVEKGVKQGAVLSPLLFSIYINTLVEELGETGLGVKMGQGTIESLFYADDIVLLADKPHKLQQLMDVVTRFGIRWRCEINRKKSQVVVYGDKRGIVKRKWMLGSGEIAQVEAYKYLGVEFERKKGWRGFRERMLRKALKVSGIVKVICRRNRMLSTDVKIMLWNGLVRPLLEYGAEVWGTGTGWKLTGCRKKWGSSS